MSGTYERPDRLEDALRIAAPGDVTVAAGCTDLFPATERKVLAGHILDLTGIPDLRQISRDGDGLRIGATVTWSDIIKADLPPAFDGLKLAAREVGATQIQNRGTLAGNLCNASPAADGVPALLTLETEIELSSTRGTRRLPLSDFIQAPRQTALKPGEIVTAILIPGHAMEGQGHFLKLGARAYLVISIAMVAARVVIRDGLVTEAALAIGSCSPVATRLPQAEAALIGAPLDPARIRDEDVAPCLSPIDDVRADAGFRTQSAAELLRRALTALEAHPKVAA